MDMAIPSLSKWSRGGTHVPGRRPCRARWANSELDHPPERGVPCSSPTPGSTSTQRTSVRQPQSDPTAGTADRIHHLRRAGGPPDQRHIPSLTGDSGAPGLMVDRRQIAGSVLVCSGVGAVVLCAARSGIAAIRTRFLCLVPPRTLLDLVEAEGCSASRDPVGCEELPVHRLFGAV